MAFTISLTSCFDTWASLSNPWSCTRDGAQTSGGEFGAQSHRVIRHPFFEKSFGVEQSAAIFPLAICDIVSSLQIAKDVTDCTQGNPSRADDVAIGNIEQVRPA